MDISAWIEQNGIAPLLALAGFMMVLLGPSYCVYAVKKNYYTKLQGAAYAILAFFFGFAMIMAAANAN